MRIEPVIRIVAEQLYLADAEYRRQMDKIYGGTSEKARCPYEKIPYHRIIKYEVEAAKIVSIVKASAKVIRASRKGKLMKCGHCGSHVHQPWPGA